MSNFDSAKTKSGVELPLMNLKGKAYMLVAHRILWLNEDVHKFTVSTEFSLLTDEQAVARAHVCIYDEAGNLVKSATATKRETKKDFPDFTEKAETGAIGRAVTLLGFGTAFALADLAEGDRIIDAPLKVEQKEVGVMVAQKLNVVEAKEPVVPMMKVEDAYPTQPPATPVKKTTFRKPAAPKEQKVGGWD